MAERDRALSARTAYSGDNVLRRAWRASFGGLAAIVIFGAFINILKFAMPLYALQMLDRIPTSRSIETLVMLTGIALAAVISGVALHAIRRRMLGQWGAWIEHRFGQRFVHAALNGDATGNRNSAFQALDDLSTLRNFVSRAAAGWLDLVWAPIFITAVFLIHPVFGWLQLCWN